MPSSSEDKGILLLALEDWVKEQKRLLQLEQNAEIEQAVNLFTKSTSDELEALGVSLARVTVLDQSNGLFGRTILKVGDPFGRPLPAHKFTPGDIVGLRLGGRALSSSKASSADGSKQAVPIRSMYDASGVVTTADANSISLALDEDTQRGRDDKADDMSISVGDRVAVDILGDEVTHNRLLAVLDELGGMKHGPAARILRLLFPMGYANTTAGRTIPEFHDSVPPVVQPASSAAKGVGGKDSTTGTPAAGGDSDASASNGFTPLRAGLNPSQLAAISACLRAKDIAMIHGPPGTGKTTAVVEYIRQEAARGRRVLATAPSNVAVDNIVERLVVGAPGLKVVRLGHPARVSTAMLSYSLDAHVQRSDGSAIVQDVRKDLVRVQAEIRKVGRRDKAKRAELRAEERSLRSEIRTREERIVVETLSGADVVLCTVTGAATKVLRKAIIGGAGGKNSGGDRGGDRRDAHGLATPIDRPAAVSDGPGLGPSPKWFDVVVVDEVAQAVEVACFIPALLGSKLVVAGDHLQLPPTVVSEEAAAQGLAVTVADRLVALYEPRTETKAAEAVQAGKASKHSHATSSAVHIPASVLAKLPPPPATSLPVVHMLEVQYRMHEDICGWASNALYGGRLVPHESVAHHTLDDLPAVHAILDKAEVDSSTGEAVVRVKASSIDNVRAAAAESAKESRLAAASAPPPNNDKRGGKGSSTSGTSSTVQLMDARTAAAVEAQSLRKGPGADNGPSQGSFRDLLVDIQALNSPLLLVDTAGCGMDEVTDLATGSTSNVREADVAVKHLLALLAAGMEEKQIAIVTPYNAQVSLLRAMLASTHPQLEIRTVDGFQGQEKEAIVLSLVRSNDERNVGFLADYRRMNVAVTRARRHAAIVADSDTVTSDPFLKGLVSYVEEHGQVRSASDYDDAVVGAAGVDDDGDAGTGGNKAVTATANAAASGQPAAVKATSTKAGTTKSKHTAPGETGTGKPRGDSKAAQAMLQLIRKQLRAFMKACDESIGEGPDGLARRLGVLELAGYAAAAASGPDVDVNLQRELATIGSCRAAAGAETAASRVDYPSALSPLQRALVHRAASDLGLPHASSGEGQARRIAVGWAPAPQRAVLREAAIKGQVPVSTPLPSTPMAPTGLTAPAPVATGQPVSTVDGAAGAEGTAETAAATEPVHEATWTDLLAQLDLGDDEEDGAGPAVAYDQSATAVPKASKGKSKGSDQKSSKAAALPQPSIPAPDAASAAVPGKPLSLLAQLAADRAARAGGAGAAQGADSSTATAAIEPGLSLQPAAGKKKKGKGKKGNQGASTSSPGPAVSAAIVDADGVRREFGVPVLPVKAIGADVAGKASSAKAAAVAPSPAADAAGAADTTDSAVAAGGAASIPAPSKQSKGKGKDKKKGSKAPEPDDDFDEEMALLDASIAQSKVCAVKGCARSTQTTGTTCRFCNLRFCYTHGQPEVHGCGDAVRASARQKWVDSAGNLTVLGGGSGSGAAGGSAAISAPLPSWKRDALSTKLEKKLDAAAADRAPQDKKKDKK